MKLALLPKKTRGGTVSASLVLHFGDAKSVTGKGVAAAQSAGSLLMRGTAKHTRQQIQDELDKLKAQMGASGISDARQSSASAPSTPVSPMRCAWPRKFCASPHFPRPNSNSSGKP